MLADHVQTLHISKLVLRYSVLTEYWLSADFLFYSEYAQRIVSIDFDLSRTIHKTG